MGIDLFTRVKGIASHRLPPRGGSSFLRRRHAFTLIELLVVIAIIAILATLTIAGVRTSMDAGRSTRCASNLRQIFVGMQAYLQDSNNRLMQRFNNDTADGYDEILLPYVANATGIFTCPSQRRRDYPQQPGYGLNWYYDNQSIFKVDQPSKTIFVAETLGTGTGSHRADRDSAGIGRLDSERHSGGTANYLFFDGHVSKLKSAQTRENVGTATDADGNSVAVDMWGVDYGAHGH